MTTQEKILASFKELEQDAKDVADFMALAEMVKAAKVNRHDGHYTMGEDAMTMKWGARIAVGSPTGDGEGGHFVNIHTSTVTASLMAECNAHDLRTHAAHCLAAAEELDELQKPK
jgi:hypothetical protein